MDAAGLRAQFPVLERTAYLNAGTDGPVPEVAVRATRAELDRELRDGRFAAHFERRSELCTANRAAYAALIGAVPEDVALTTSTSEGMGLVLAGLDLGPDDEIVCSDQEHPGLIGPLIAARARGVRVRTAPLAELAEAVGPQTTLVACSHVGWLSGEVAPAALSELGVPVLLDGAQGAGAVPVDVATLGCAAYAAAGQKWLCGPDGTGFLYLEPAFAQRLRVTAPSYLSLADPGAGLDAEMHPDARRFDTPALSAEATAFAAAALGVLAEAGWDEVHERGKTLAAALARRLAEAGHRVAPRGETTLVSWECADPAGEKQRLVDEGLVVRDLPGTRLLRASVGAWNDESDLERLLGALSPP